MTLVVNPNKQEDMTAGVIKTD